MKENSSFSPPAQQRDLEKQFADIASKKDLLW